MLAYGIAADATDEYIKIGESTAIQSLKKICRAVVEVFAEQYLRSPNANDVARLLHIGKRRGFPGMLGSLDCMHWKWKNCPTAWAGQYAGRSGSPTIILEAVADYDLWIWHAYFGLPFSNNDINVLEASHLFANLAEDERDVDAAIEDWMEAPTPEVEIAFCYYYFFKSYLKFLDLIASYIFFFYSFLVDYCLKFEYHSHYFFIIIVLFLFMSCLFFF
ncbi:hypothetical protein UlMin_037197 [Ulmus minor]